MPSRFATLTHPSYGIHHSALFKLILHAYSVPRITYCHLSALCVGAHRLEGGKASKHIHLLDNVDNLQEDSSIANPFLPKNGIEARETLRLALYQQYHIPLRLLEAMASMRLNQYPHYRKGNCLM